MIYVKLNSTFTIVIVIVKLNSTFTIFSGFTVTNQPIVKKKVQKKNLKQKKSFFQIIIKFVVNHDDLSILKFKRKSFISSLVVLQQKDLEEEIQKK
jgi:hypothetical protein